MTVTCDTVRRAFGEFQCCKECHYDVTENDEMLPDVGEMFRICCGARVALQRNGVDVMEPVTHPALLRAIEEQV